MNNLPFYVFLSNFRRSRATVERTSSKVMPVAIMMSNWSSRAFQGPDSRLQMTPISRWPIRAIARCVLLQEELQKYIRHVWKNIKSSFAFSRALANLTTTMEIHTEWITSGPLPDSKRIKKGCQAWIDYPSNREIKIFHHINIWIRATAGVFTELALYIGIGKLNFPFSLGGGAKRSRSRLFFN